MKLNVLSKLYVLFLHPIHNENNMYIGKGKNKKREIKDKYNMCVGVIPGVANSIFYQSFFF